MLPLSGIPNFCYVDELHQTWTVISTLSVAYRTFKQVKLIEQFQRLKYHINQMGKDKSPAFTRKNLDFFQFLGSEALFDSIKISMCLENYMKAALLNQGFVIHSIDSKVSNKKYKFLYDKQQSEPVLISELKVSEPFSIEHKNNKYVIESLKPYTLGLPFILDELNYMTYLQEIDQDLKQVILFYYQARNRLHFIASNFSVFSSDTLIELIQLINFVNKNIVKHHNNLIVSFEYKYNLSLFSEGAKLSEIII